MQKEITASLPLLDAEGNLNLPGYAKRLLPVYRRDDVTNDMPPDPSAIAPQTGLFTRIAGRASQYPPKGVA